MARCVLNAKQFRQFTKPFEFTSYIADNTAQTDYVLYNQLQKQRLGLSIMFLTCDGILLISPDWTTGKIAGLKPTTLKDRPSV